MAGTLLVSGQEWVLDQMLVYLNTSGACWVGLMQESSDPLPASQIGAGITEIDPLGDGTGSGYLRQYCSGWVKTLGGDPYISGPAVSWTVSGSWQSVNGYFVATASGLSDASAIWAQPFPSGSIGDKTDGKEIIVVPRYEQTDYSE